MTDGKIGWFVPHDGDTDEEHEEVIDTLEDAGYALTRQSGGQLLADDTYEIES